jgi:hypothetical protein
MSRFCSLCDNEAEYCDRAEVPYCGVHWYERKRLIAAMLWKIAELAEDKEPEL